MVQVIARSLETALHQLHERGFDLERIVRGTGTAPFRLKYKDHSTQLAAQTMRFFTAVSYDLM